MNRLFPLSIAALACAILSQPAAAQSRYEFFQAVEDGNFDVVSKGVEGQGSKLVNARDDDQGATPLFLVTQQRKLDWMNYMLLNGADPDIGANGGDRPLHIAAQSDFVEGAKLLINRGAQVDIRGSSGETPLIRAVRMRNTEMVKLLMRRGANPDLSDTSTGRSARDYALEDPRGRAMRETIEMVEKESSPSATQTVDDFDFSGDFLPAD